MTSRSPAAVDLSSVFGAAAAAAVRHRFRRRRTEDAPEPREPAPEPAGPTAVEAVVPVPRSRPARARPASAAVQTAVDRPADAAPRRRPGAVKVRDREHVDLLLLAAATGGPASGRELTDRVRERSGGVFALPLRVVIHRLHRLTTNRLMQVVEGRGAHRYLLTPLGERVLARRRREWEAFSLGLNRVLEAPEAADPSR